MDEATQDLPKTETVPAAESVPATETEPKAETEPDTEPEPVITDELRQAIEAIVLVAEDPVPAHVLGMLTSLPPDLVARVCDELAADYEAQGRGFRLASVGGGYRFQTARETAPYVERFVLEGQTTRLSAAALETLAIVAYKQPLSRMQVAAIRGVNVDAVMRTLQSRGYIDDIGRDPGPGQATLFGTTQLFLEKMGLNSLGQLPTLGDFMPAPEVVEILEQTLRPERMDVDSAVAAATDLLADETEATEATDGVGGETDGETAAESADAMVIDLTTRTPESSEVFADDSPAPAE